jgi:uncharacterized protein
LNTLLPQLAQQLNLNLKQVENTHDLLSQGATIPFIARYRKEATGSLDEVQIEAIAKEFKALEDLAKRKATILEAIAAQEQLSDELRQKINNTQSATELEDLYLPYKQKRKTRASVAKEKGLEPLAGSIMKQELNNVTGLAERFLSADVPTVDDALAGARDIMAEWINERAYARNKLRMLFNREALISAKLVKGKDEEAAKYRDYFAFSEALKRIPSHRLLAIRRGENEGFLKVSIAPSEEKALDALQHIFCKTQNTAAQQVALAVVDSYKRLLKPALENEFKALSKAKADESAIAIFAENLRQLLLTAPLGAKRTLAIDPGFKSGCKVVCLDEHGQLLYNENIYPHPPQNEKARAAAKIAQLAEAYKIDAIAIGNGTAGRETEHFISKTVRFKRPLQVFVVNEAGASIYSASKIARAEFPGYDVTVRGAVSIGRRLMDPLAELVKIEPKSIGVGQYQHDVDQNLLKESLNRVVESVVNQVGVNLNTASPYLLEHVSGLGPKLAANVVAYRDEHGAFTARETLKKVPKLGPKAFEQCAGFLRINKGVNPLDNSAVHPESYALVKAIAKDLKLEVSQLIGAKKLLAQLDLEKYVKGNVGLPTLQTIAEDLAKVGRDVRGATTHFQFDSSVSKIGDLKEGMVLPGIVTNITNFGAFVDVGVKQDGLVHISELAEGYISDPNQVVRLQQQLRVKVISIDLARKRLQFSLKQV